MPRLLVNPGTPAAWEIELQPGPNRVGSNESNDFQIDHPSVSGFHCEFILSDAGVLLKDLGSARGSYLNRESVKEAFLQPGQHIQLGSVAMIFEPPVSGAAASSGQVMVAAPTPAPAASAPFSGSPLPTPIPGALPASLGPTFCKVHPETPARFFCNTCHNYFCDTCVATHAAENCTAAPGATGETILLARTGDLSTRLPRALGYPFRDNGLLILIAGTLVFAGLALLSDQFYGVILQVAALLYLFAFLRNIIVATATGKSGVPDLPGFSELLRSILGTVGATVVAFGLAGALTVATTKFEMQIPEPVILAAIILGCGYFPMAFLAVTLKDSALAANPITVLPAILKTALIYLLPAILMMGIFHAGLHAAVVGHEAKDLEQSTQSMATVLTIFAARAAWSFLTVYLLVVVARLLGVIFVARSRKLGWFDR